MYGLLRKVDISTVSMKVEAYKSCLVYLLKIIDYFMKSSFKVSFVLVL